MTTKYKCEGLLWFSLQVVGIRNNKYGIRRQLVLIIPSVPMQCNAFTCAVQHAYIILNNAVARCGCICILLRRKQYDFIISQLE